MSFSYDNPLEITAAQQWLSAAFEAVRHYELNGIHRSRITLATEDQDQFLDWFEVRFPRSFPNQQATIWVDRRWTLVVPHIEREGKVCLRSVTGHAKEGANLVSELVSDFARNAWPQFAEDFDNSDEEFLREVSSYWDIYVQPGRSSYRQERREKLLLLENPEKQGDKLVCYLDTKQKVGFLSHDSSIARRQLLWTDETQADVDRITKDLKGTIRRIEAFSFNLDSALTPHTWPSTPIEPADLIQLLPLAQLPSEEQDEFKQRMKKAYTHLHDALYIVLSSPQMIQGFYVSTHNILPVHVQRMDHEWCVTRGQGNHYSQRHAANILFLGAGSLGSSVAETLIRSGIGNLTVVDSDILEPANLGRHTLTRHRLFQFKAPALAKRLSAAMPGANVIGDSNDAVSFLTRNLSNLPRYSLIVDATGDIAVREALDQLVSNQMIECPVAICWLEPYCSASHTCILLPNTRWLREGKDPADLINTGEWLPEVHVKLPACSATFQPYGMAAMGFGTSLASEAILDVIDGKPKQSEIRSWVRGSRDFPDSKLSSRNPWAQRSFGLYGEVVVRSWSTLKPLT